MFRSSWWTWLFKVGLCLGLAWWSAQDATDSSVKGDATQNLKITHNLYFHGKFSLGGDKSDLKPTNFREPLPPLVTALYLKVVLPDANADDFENWHHGSATRLIKQVNGIWTFLGMLAFLEVALTLIRSRWLAWLAFVAVYALFFGADGVTNTLYTELPAASMMLLTTWSLLAATRAPGSNMKSWLSGISLGALVLTKAVFLFATPALLLILLWTGYSRQNPTGRVQTVPGEPVVFRWRHAIVMLAGATIVVAPWMIRNKLALDTFEVSSGRGGYVLLERAYMDEMTEDEFRLGFATYGPYLFRQLVRGTSLEITNQDVMKGGRVQRLNYGRSDFQEEDRRSIALRRPDLSLSFYTRPAALYQIRLDAHRQDGTMHPELAADRDLKAEAMAIITRQPLAHLKVASLIIWAEFWAFSTQPHRSLKVLPIPEQYEITVINLITGVCLLGGFAYAWIGRNLRWAILAGLPGTLLILHGLLTQGLPRLNAPLVPFMLLSFFATLTSVIARFTAKRTKMKPIVGGQ